MIHQLEATETIARRHRTMVLHSESQARQHSCPFHRKRSTPIEIPTPRKSTLTNPSLTIPSPTSLTSRPAAAAASPDLIFEMSPLDSARDPVLSTVQGPVSSTFQKECHLSFLERDALRCIASQPKSTIREPFLYNFPVLTSNRFASKFPPSSVSEFADGARGSTATAGPERCEGHRLEANSVFPWDGEPSPSPSQAPFRFPAQTTRKFADQNIIGFQTPNLVLPTRSYSGSPPLPSLLFQSRGACSIVENLDTSCSSSDTNLGSFQLDNYLVGKIDDERRSNSFSHRQPI